MFVQGFFDGAIAEVLLYNRVLADSEALAVREYLSRKYAVLPESLVPQAAGKGQPEYRVADPPPVQVLVPGFAVRGAAGEADEYQQPEVPSRRQARRPGL